MTYEHPGDTAYQMPYCDLCFDKLVPKDMMVFKLTSRKESGKEINWHWGHVCPECRDEFGLPEGYYHGYLAHREPPVSLTAVRSGDHHRRHGLTAVPPVILDLLHACAANKLHVVGDIEWSGPRYEKLRKKIRDRIESEPPYSSL